MMQQEQEPTRRARFSLGMVVATPGAIEAAAAANDVLMRYVARHVLGEWGDLPSEDVRANERALTDGSRLLSAYHLRNGTRIWIWTEADRSSTCVMLPEEY
jgi:hypothetical protein